MNNFEITLNNSKEQSTFRTSDFTEPQKKDNFSWFEIGLMSIVGPIFRKLGILSGYEYQLMNAIVSDSASEVRKLCNLGADFNTTLFHVYGYTPAIFAVECGSTHSLDELIRMGADINKRADSRDKITALYLASRSNCFVNKEKQINILHELLQSGAKPNLAIKGGSTPLMEASYQGNEEAIQKLIEYGADLNFIDNKKNTALDLAINRLGPHNLTVQKMISLGAKCFTDLDEQFTILSPSRLFLSEHNFSLNVQLHPKINREDIFRSGYLLPNQTLKAIIDYRTNSTNSNWAIPIRGIGSRGKECKIKKYDEKFPSLFRSFLRGQSDYILYDSRAFLTTCEGCLRGISPHNYLGEGGEAKVKIAQIVQTGEFVAVRIPNKIGKYEIEILKKMNLLIEYIHTENKHYVIQKLLQGDRLSDYFYSAAFHNLDSQKQYETIQEIMIQLLRQLNCLHTNGYLHRDLSPDNIMIDPETNQVTIIDFGWAIKEPNFLNGYIYDNISKLSLGMAPELYKPTKYGYPYSQQTDIYAFGKIFNDFLKLSRSDQVHVLGEQIYQQMMAQVPEERRNAQYYLDILEKW